MVGEKIVGNKAAPSMLVSKITDIQDALFQFLISPTDGSRSLNRKIHGVVFIHVDDLFWTGDEVFKKKVMEPLLKEYQVGKHQINDFISTGIRIVRHQNSRITLDQDKGIEELEEVSFDSKLPVTEPRTPHLHTEYRSKLGGQNWFQSRTQYHICYGFS